MRLVLTTLCLLLALPVLGVMGAWLALDAQALANLRHQWETVLPDYALQSALLAGGVALGVVLLGSATAAAVTLFHFPGRRFFEWALLLPLAMPAYVLAYAWTDALQFSSPLQRGLREAFGTQGQPLSQLLGQIRSLPGAVMLFVLCLYPYVYLLVRTALGERAARMMEAARLLGAPMKRRVLEVALPMARPAIAAGTALALMETLADYGVGSYFGLSTFSTGIYKAWLVLGDRVAAAQLAAVLLLVVGALLMAERQAQRRMRFVARGGGGGASTDGGAMGAAPAGAGDFSADALGDGSGDGSGGSSGSGPGSRSQGSAQGSSEPRSAADTRLLRPQRSGVALLWLLCATPVLLGFVLPVAWLTQMVWTEAQHAELGLPLARFAQWAWTSFKLAAGAAVLATLLALVLAFVLRQGHQHSASIGNRALPTAARVLSLGYAVPGAVIAVGVLAPLGWVQAQWPTSGAAAWVTGTLLGLMYAYLVRFSAVALQSVEAGYARVPISVDETARLLGGRPWRLWTELHLPLLKRSALAAGLLVFVDVMKELPATLVLRPFGNDTLAVVAYNLARDERLAEAALPSLAIVAVGLLPVILLSRALRGPAG